MAALLLSTLLGMGLHEKHVSSLLQGKTVKLNHSHLTGEVPVYCNKTLLKKLEKAHSAGKGCCIKFSDKMIKHHVKHGGSIWSDMWEKLKSMGKVGYSKVVQPLMDTGLDMGTKYLQTKGQDLLQQANEELKNRLDLPVKRGRGRPRKIQGEGFFGDIFDAAKSIVSPVVQRVLPMAGNLAGNILERGILRKLGGDISGGSFTLPQAPPSRR